MFWLSHLEQNDNIYQTPVTRRNQSSRTLPFKKWNILWNSKIVSDTSPCPPAHSTLNSELTSLLVGLAFLYLHCYNYRLLKRLTNWSWLYLIACLVFFYKIVDHTPNKNHINSLNKELIVWNNHTFRTNLHIKTHTQTYHSFSSTHFHPIH